VPIFHGISREHYAMHATKLFIGRSNLTQFLRICAFPIAGNTESQQLLNFNRNLTVTTQ